MMTMMIRITSLYIYAKQAMHNAVAHHPTNATQPVPEQQSLPLANSLSLYTDHNIIWNRIPLGQFGLTVLAAFPPQFPMHLAG